MQAYLEVEPWWAAITVWAVVNAVNLLQAAGFLSRVRSGNKAINYILGYMIIALAVPATFALIAFILTKSGWMLYAGPVVFIVFIAFMIAVDYVSPVEFRSPVRHGILVPYLLLFFGAILLMGLPMFGMDLKLWLITLITTLFHLVSMVIAMRNGVG